MGGRVTRFFAVFASAMVLCGCPPDDQFEYGGLQTYDSFPFDGNRSWTWISTDQEVTYWLVGQTRSEDPDPENPDYRIYNVDYSTDCRGADPDCVEGEVIRSVAWSSDINYGVYIHSWEEAGDRTEFDPPLVLAGKQMKPGDSVVTETAGYEWTATLEGIEACDVNLNVVWNDCLRITLDDGDEDDRTNVGLTGTYWAIKSQNVVTFELVGEGGRWRLNDSDCVDDEGNPACDGIW